MLVTRLAFTAAAMLAVLPAVTSAETDSPAAAAPICGGHTAPSAPAAPARELLQGYGTGGFAVRTASPRAQAFFDNGMQLGHAFAHQASIEAFQEARRLDPGCAMCAWGEAWARGPTINYTIDRKTVGELAAIADKAAQLAAGGPEKERRLAAALQLRYRHGGGAGPGDLAFARAMDRLARDFPDDNEIAVIAADAWMIPAFQGGRRETLNRAIVLLAGALQRNPNDTGAIHFYIHATELAGVPDRALPFAVRLQALAPAASHLVHMPSHTYYWIGRYAAAEKANEDAVAIDHANARRLKTEGGAWGLVYHAHNVKFGTGAALMAGDAAGALALAHEGLARIAEPKAELGPWDQSSLGHAYFAEGRYASQAEVAGLADPGDKRAYLRAMWRYARGEAAARRGDAPAVKAEAAQVQVPEAAMRAFGRDAAYPRAIVDIARLVLQGRAAELEGRPAEAARAFRAAAERQETALRDSADPPGWWYPVRRSLAAAELASGQPAKAAQDATAALARDHDDPLSLAVLARAQQALGHPAQAAQSLDKAKAGWRGEAAALDPRQA